MRKTVGGARAPSRGPARTRSPPEAGPTASRRVHQDDDAVSPVVGMVMVLGISIVGIAAILYWGLPAISELKAGVEFQAVMNQFEDLNADVDELVRGTPGQTAKRWRPSFDQGSVVLHDDSERWIVGADLDPIYNFTVEGLFETTDNSFTVTNFDDSQQTVRVNAWTLDGGKKTPVVVSDDATCTDTSQMDQEVLAASGGTHTFCLFENDGDPLNVDGITLKILVTDLVDPMGAPQELEAAVFYLVDSGAIEYAMTVGTSQRHAYHANGAIVHGRPDDLAITQQPPFGPPRDAGGQTRFFGRLVQYNGQAAFGGSDRFDVLMSLYSTSSLESAEDAASLKVWVDGTTKDAWYAYLDDDANGYAFDRTPDNDAVTYLEYRPSGGYDLRLVYSVITIQG